MFYGRSKLNKAFTLYELMIAIALFAIVAGLVLTFVSFMSSYVDTGNQALEKNNQSLDIRKEIDFWFSVFDQQDWTFDTSSEDCVISVSDGVSTYDVRIVQSEVDGDIVSQLQFSYPKGSLHGDEEGTFNYVRLDCSTVDYIVIKPFDQQVDIVSKSLRFVIDCRVLQAQYLCMIVFK